jgi:hypothetical protein
MSSGRPLDLDGNIEARLMVTTAGQVTDLEYRTRLTDLLDPSLALNIPTPPQANSTTSGDGVLYMRVPVPTDCRLFNPPPAPTKSPNFLAGLLARYRPKLLARPLVLRPEPHYVRQHSFY